MSGERDTESKKRTERVIGTVFLTSVACASSLGGFSYAVVAAKKQSPSQFAKGLESGAALGLRALGWGSVVAVGGVGLFTFGICRLLGVHSVSEFRTAVENALKPRVPAVKEASPPGRRNFASIRELFEYLASSPSPSQQPVSDRIER